MTDIATNLNTIDGSLSDIKTAIVNKGGTVSGNITTFATAIDNIPSGGGSTPAERTVKANYWVDTSGVVHNIYDNYSQTDISANTTVLGDSAYVVPLIPDKTILKKLDMSAVVTMGTNRVSCNSMCKNSTTLEAVDLSSLTTINGNIDLGSMCWGCTNLTEFNMSALTTINHSTRILPIGGILYNTSVTQFKLDNLTSITGNAGIGDFLNGSSITGDYVLPKLSNITSPNALLIAFRYSNISSVSFPALTTQSFGSATSQFNTMLEGDTDVTVHFPSNLQSVIGSWTDVVAGFNGTNTTVLFDLPATS